MFEDEGYELAKALLMTHQRLYTAVWWDHPPLHPGILHTGAALLGNGAQSFRIIAGLLCAASLWALGACAGARRRGGSVVPVSNRHCWAGAGIGSGLLAPFAAVVLCVSSSSFLPNGLSVTITLPALGFGLAAVWLWQRSGCGSDLG